MALPFSCTGCFKTPIKISLLRHAERISLRPNNSSVSENNLLVCFFIQKKTEKELAELELISYRNCLFQTE